MSWMKNIATRGQILREYEASITMTPHEYQQFALSTYCAPDHVDRRDYLHHLLIEEVGEVMSLFAKSMRDGHDVDRDRLVSELGDVLWCVACLTQAPLPLSNVWTGIRKTTWDRCVCASNLTDAPGNAWDLARFVNACDPTLTLADIAIANVRKLRSRRDRGVLRGSGDDR